MQPSFLVSIQLMSPASGDQLVYRRQSPECNPTPGFHSINVPSEWGPRGCFSFCDKTNGEVSIQLMSPASGDLPKGIKIIKNYGSFHSINVPSEWGHIHGTNLKSLSLEVSIQLMSPASGDSTSVTIRTWYTSLVVSIQLMSPASGDESNLSIEASVTAMFPFN